MELTTRIKRFRVLLIGLLLTGCARTEITREGVTHVSSGIPYHKILVCTLSGDPARASMMETVMTRRLRKHHITADRCTDVFAALRGNSADEAATNIQLQSYDAVLIVQRKPVPPYPTLQDFISAYEKGIPVVPKNSAPLEGTASMMAVRENQIVWTADGLLYGDPNAPLENIFKDFAKLIDGGLEDEGFVP